MQTSDALNKAGDHIQRYGHEVGRAHGEGEFRTAPACMIGAIGVATVDEPNSRAETGALDALRIYLADTCIPEWSDAHSPTEVVEAFRAVALIEAAKEDLPPAGEVSERETAEVSRG